VPSRGAQSGAPSVRSAPWRRGRHELCGAPAFKDASPSSRLRSRHQVDDVLLREGLGGLVGSRRRGSRHRPRPGQGRRPEPPVQEVDVEPPRRVTRMSGRAFRMRRRSVPVTLSRSVAVDRDEDGRAREKMNAGGSFRTGTAALLLGVQDAEARLELVERHRAGPSVRICWIAPWYWNAASGTVGNCVFTTRMFWKYTVRAWRLTCVWAVIWTTPKTGSQRRRRTETAACARD